MKRYEKPNLCENDSIGLLPEDQRYKKMIKEDDSNIHTPNHTLYFNNQKTNNIFRDFTVKDSGNKSFDDFLHRIIKYLYQIIISIYANDSSFVLPELNQEDTEIGRASCRERV